MGVKKLLQAGIENEEKAFTNKGTKPKTKVDGVFPEISNEPTEPEPVIQKGNRVKEGSRRVVKKKGGRPKNEEIGLKSRKQYTLTLKEDDYKEFLSRARSEDISFAKFMEKAAKEYIENHKE